MDEQNSMRHIGIVGITTVGACICANEIVAALARQDSLGLGEHPEYTMHVFPFAMYKKCVIEKDWDKMADIILMSIDKLKSAGANFIIIPSNTPHYAIEKIKASSPLPVVNLVEITADECKHRGFKKVAVLGTKSTMQDGLYDKELQLREINPVIPEESVRNRVDNLIMNEIIPSQINPITVQDVAKDIKKLECDAVILGCTELPEVYNEDNLGLPVVDTTRLLAQKALELSTKLEAWHEFSSSKTSKFGNFF